MEKLEILNIIIEQGNCLKFKCQSCPLDYFCATAGNGEYILDEAMRMKKELILKPRLEIWKELKN